MKTSIQNTPDGRLVVCNSEDVEPILEYAKERARAGFGRSASNELHEAAHFPGNIVMAYCQSHNITFGEFLANPEHVKNMLADPALRDFQVVANNPHKTWR